MELTRSVPISSSSFLSFSLSPPTYLCTHERRRTFWETVGRQFGKEEKESQSHTLRLLSLKKLFLRPSVRPYPD